LAAGHAIGFHDLYTGNFSIRRSVLDDVGLFDESFVLYGNEDGELGIRLMRAGVRFAYEPDAIAHQRYLKSFADIARDNIGKGHTAVQLARKHPSVLPNLRLGAGSSWRLRILRTVLLGMTDLSPVTPRLVVAALDAVGSVMPALAEYAYPAALDYFFWLGVRTERRSHEAAPPPS
jgi:hypothetical protein